MSLPSLRSSAPAPLPVRGARICDVEARLLRAAAGGHLYCVSVHGSAAGFVDLQGERPFYPRSEWVFSALCLGWVIPSSRGPLLRITDAGRNALAQLDYASTAARPGSSLLDSAESLGSGVTDSIR